MLSSSVLTRIFVKNWKSKKFVLSITWSTHRVQNLWMNCRREGKKIAIWLGSYSKSVIWAKVEIKGLKIHAVTLIPLFLRPDEIMQGILTLVIRLQKKSGLKYLTVSIIGLSDFLNGTYQLTIKYKISEQRRMGCFAVA